MIADPIKYLIGLGGSTSDIKICCTCNNITHRIYVNYNSDSIRSDHICLCDRSTYRHR
ncbi:hypothetical protein Hanom_Chr12g01137391 [Helianthus anomalus]